MYIFPLPKQWTRETYVSYHEDSLKVSKQKEWIQYSIMYIMLKRKLQIEKIEDSAIWTKLVILEKLSVTHK